MPLALNLHLFLILVRATLLAYGTDRRKQLVRAALTPGTLPLVRVYVAVQAERARIIFRTPGNV